MADDAGPSEPPPPSSGDSVADPDEVATLADLGDIHEEFTLGEDDAPEGGFSDDESSLADDASQASDMSMAEQEVELPPPAEDHSVLQLTAHTDAVFAVAVNAAQPELLATGGGDDVAHIWRLGKAQPEFRLDGHTDTVSALGFSADGTLLASGGLDGQVRVWHAATGALAVALEGPTQGIAWLAWHDRGNVLLAGCEDATAWMWKLPEGTVMQIFSAHAATVSYGCFANQGRAVLTASEDGSIRVWNPRAGTVDHCLHAGTYHEPVAVTCLAAHPAQPIFIFGTGEGALKLAHAETGKVLAQLPAHEASVESASFCGPLALCASAAMDGKLCVWDLANFSLRHTCTHQAGVVECAWLKDSPMLLSCAISREICLWDGRSGECLQTLTGHTEAVLCMAVGYTSQGVYVLSGSDDKTARVWQPRL